MQNIEDESTYNLKQTEKNLSLYIERAQKEKHLFPDLDRRIESLSQIQMEIRRRENG